MRTFVSSSFVRIFKYNLKRKKMSLLNDLIPEVKELLEADKEKFPNLHKGIINDLQNANVTTDVKVSTANTLIGYAEAANVKFDSSSFVLKLYEIFGR